MMIASSVIKDEQFGLDTNEINRPLQKWDGLFKNSFY